MAILETRPMRVVVPGDLFRTDFNLFLYYLVRLCDTKTDQIVVKKLKYLKQISGIPILYFVFD